MVEKFYVDTNTGVKHKIVRQETLFENGFATQLSATINMRTGEVQYVEEILDGDADHIFFTDEYVARKQHPGFFDDIFLLQYKKFGDFCAEILTPYTIAQIVGGSDFNECSNFECFRVAPGNMPEKLEIIHEHITSCIVVKDEAGQEVFVASYPEH